MWSRSTRRPDPSPLRCPMAQPSSRAALCSLAIRQLNTDCSPRSRTSSSTHQLSAATRSRSKFRPRGSNDFPLPRGIPAHLFSTPVRLDPLAILTDGVSPLTYGIVQPVSQLGSSEINGGLLRQNADGSGNPDGTYTIWLAPVLPTGAFIENWIPTPSQKALAALYPDAKVLNSKIWPVFRIYAGQAGSAPPSILPCPECPSSETVGGDQSGSPFPNDSRSATCRFPLIQKLPPPQP